MKKAFKLAMIAISMVLAMSFAVHAQSDDSKKVDSKYVDQNDNCWTIYKDDSFEVSNEDGIFRTGMISKMAGIGASNTTFIVTKELDKNGKMVSCNLSWNGVSMGKKITLIPTSDMSLGQIILKKAKK